MAAQSERPGKPSDAQTERASVLWQSYLTGDHSRLDTRVKVVRRVFRHLPSAPRCSVCNAPFRGIGGFVVNLFGLSNAEAR